MGDYIRFDNEHVGPVIDRQKRTTIRKGEPFVWPGDIVDLKTAGGNVFAQAKVKGVFVRRASMIPSMDFDYHRDYDTWLGFKSEMEEYYGEITPDTDFTVIAFDTEFEE